MKRLILILSAAAVLIAVNAQATHIYVSGDVTGTWSVDTVFVQADINVPANQSLTIQPGVLVLFQGHYYFSAGSNAIFQAHGTEQDSIIFSPVDTTVGWASISFNQVNDLSYLYYCAIRYSKVGTGSNGGGVEINSCSPELKHCSIEHCTAGINGGGIYCNASSPQIQNCRIANCSATNNGGGICVYGNGVTIQNCQIEASSASFQGGGIYIEGDNNIVQNCYIDSCTTGFVGGGILLYGNNWNLTDCIITHNTAHRISGGSNAGGICAYGTNSIIKNCLISSNLAWDGTTYICSAGGIYFNGSNLTLLNNTITNNTAESGGGLWSYDDPGIIIKNCIFYDNIPNQIYVSPSTNATITYCDIEGGGWSGAGNINSDPLFISSAPAGDWYLRQQPCQPLPQSPCVNTGDPTSPMITGTTRTDGVQDAGVVDMGYHYPLTIPYSIVLTPVNPPIVVPAGGGPFSFDVTLHNNADTLQTFAVWTIIQTPQSAFVPSLGPFTLSLPAGFSLTRTRTQIVPPYAPAGNYIYWGYVGSYPWVVVNSDSFAFTKQGSNFDSPCPAEGWLCTGDAFPGEKLGGGRTPALQPVEFTVGVTPNPFNPTTVASYELRAASHVSLRVYDTAGRLVETLVNGWQEVGEHRATFDGSGLAAGVYLYRLQAGEGTAIGKMVLLK